MNMNKFYHPLTRSLSFGVHLRTTATVPSDGYRVDDDDELQVAHCPFVH